MMIIDAWKIHRYRCDSGMSQQQLAHRARVSQQTISKLESGRVSRSAYIVDIARALKTSAERLSVDDESELT